MRLADFNGDGITDLHCPVGANQYIAFGRGNGMFTAAPTAIYWCYNPPTPADINGDGQADLDCNDNSTHWAALSSPATA